ncbi:MAG TPA: YdeI/OmpD-associated family protein [Chitinophagaceae bacterium]|nr:YdeI/OmpD-associated family protein [Chitinophagaceae bacterium]
MIRFTTAIKQFGVQGEKTGWTYIEIAAGLIQQLKPGNKRSFRVKGKLDQYIIKGVALLPMGGGSFIMALNKTMRKGIGKGKGAMLKVQLEEDTQTYQLNKEFAACLKDEPAAEKYFGTLPRSHQNYFSKWIEAAKTDPTKTKRIAMAVSALAKRKGFPEMLRSEREKRNI